MSMDFIHTEEHGIKYLVHPSESIFEGMKIRENPDDAFDNAIKRGMKILMIGCICIQTIIRIILKIIIQEIINHILNLI